MSLESKHPAYSQKIEEWIIVRHSYEGENKIKEMGVKYLPPTAGMRLDGMTHGKEGYSAYLAYKDRARFPNYVTQKVEKNIGVLHYKPPTIKLPPQMEYLRERATAEGESLELLLRRVNEEQLLTGRVGILADNVSIEGAAPEPYLALYCAESVTNWNQVENDKGASLDFVVLAELKRNVDENFNWDTKIKYRLLKMIDGSYHFGVFDDNYDPTSMSQFLILGTPSPEIPFVFINTKDLSADPDRSPVIDLANQCLSLYKSDADYRQALHLQGQDTLVVIGSRRKSIDEVEDSEIRVGTGSCIELDIGGDAKYVGISGAGLPEQRQAIENDTKMAEGMAGVVNFNSQGQKESGEALTIRVAAQTASLQQIATIGAAGLQKVLRIIAKLKGLDEQEVEVLPNTKFYIEEINGRSIVDLMAAKTMGAPLSLESVHRIMKDRGLTSMDYESELGEIAGEEPLGVESNPTQDPNPGQF